MSDNTDYRPIPGQTPLKLPQKIGPLGSAAENDTSTPPFTKVNTGAAPLPQPIPAPTTGKPLISAAYNKLPEAPKFHSPMPEFGETVSDEIPFYMPVLAGIAAVGAVVFSVLLYLKR